MSKVMRKEDYCDQNGIYAENERFILRRLHEADKENYMKLTLATTSIPQAYESESFFDLSWKYALESKDLNLSLFEKDTGTYLGNLMLKNLSGEKQEIGIDIVKEYRRKGIGYAAVRLLMSHAKEVSGADSFMVRIYSDNVASIKLFEKLGAIEADCEDSEFISAMKVMEQMTGIEEMVSLKEKYKDFFNRAEERHIIVYELRVI